MKICGYLITAAQAAAIYLSLQLWGGANMLLSDRSSLTGYIDCCRYLNIRNSNLAIADNGRGLSANARDDIIQSSLQYESQVKFDPRSRQFLVTALRVSTEVRYLIISFNHGRDEKKKSVFFLFF